MSQSTLAAISAALLLIGLIAYAVLGGADFGGGLWDLLARGPAAERTRAAIAHGMGPVWESNNVWLIFVLVITWTAFPAVFAGISTALFIPITLALCGIVLRGASFSFRSNYGMEIGAGVRWGNIFGVASLITPFFLGTVAGALAGGDIHITSSPFQVQANIWTTWTTPFALACGAFAVGLCAVLSAIYLTVDTRSAHDESLAHSFRGRALVAGAITAALGALAAVLAIGEAPTLGHGLIGGALPFTIGTLVLGLATVFALLRGAYLLARVLVATTTAGIFLAWGAAQWPYLIVQDVTVDNAASPASVLGPMLVASLIGLVILLPSLWYLFSVFKRRTTPRGPATGRGATVSAFVASFAASKSDVAPAQPPDGTELALTRRPLFRRIEPVLVLSLAVVLSVGVTAVSDVIRRQVESGKARMEERLRKRRQAGAH